MTEEFGLLSKEEEIELCKKIKEGDIEARNKLVMSNIRLVHYIIKNKYRVTPRLDYEDMVGWGVVGLIEAAKRFDYNKKCRFATYARHWIKKMLNKYVYNQASVVKVPPMQIKLVHDLHAITNKLQHMILDHEITDEEVASEINIPVDVITKIKSAFKTSPNDEDSGCDTEDLQAYEKENYDGVCMAQVYDLIAGLDFIKRDIVCRYHGINCPPQSLQEISSIYMLSRERIRQIKREALDSIRDRL